MLTLADPERALATAYAPAGVRPALTALFALDERLGGIVGATTEPTIGLVRLAWWREALQGLDAGARPAEPLLRALAATVLPLGVSGATLAEIEDGWAALLDGEPDAEAIARHGRERGWRLFTCAAVLLAHSLAARTGSASSVAPRSAGSLPDPAGDVRLRNAGEGWALADLGHRHSSPEVRAAARSLARDRLADGPRRWPKSLRPLGMLAALAKRDASSVGGRRQGSPGRLLRMLAHRLAGR